MYWKNYSLQSKLINQEKYSNDIGFKTIRAIDFKVSNSTIFVKLHIFYLTSEESIYRLLTNFRDLMKVQLSRKC